MACTPPVWTPQAEYDIFVDGDVDGLYLASQKKGAKPYQYDRALVSGHLNRALQNLAFFGRPQASPIDCAKWCGRAAAHAEKFISDFSVGGPQDPADAAARLIGMFAADILEAGLYPLNGDNLRQLIGMMRTCDQQLRIAQAGHRKQKTGVTGKRPGPATFYAAMAAAFEALHGERPVVSTNEAGDRTGPAVRFVIAVIVVIRQRSGDSALLADLERPEKIREGFQPPERRRKTTTGRTKKK